MQAETVETESTFRIEKSLKRTVTVPVFV